MTKRNSKKTKKGTDPNNGGFIFNFFKRFFFVLLLIFSIVLFCYLFVFPSILNNNIQPRNILIISSKLDVPSNNIYFAHISETESQNYFFSVPAQGLVTIPNGYGDYPLQSVYGLLKIDKKDDQFIKSTFSELLKTAIDEIVLVDSELNEIEESKISNFFLTNSIKNLFQFKLSKFTKLLYLHYQSKNILLTNLEKPEELVNYKENTATIFGDEYQYCSVAVINSSQVNSLAKNKANVIENIGALVVRIDDSEQKQNQTKIYYANDPINCKNLAKKISNIFYQTPEILSIDKLENAQQYRAKVVVIVGE